MTQKTKGAKVVNKSNARANANKGNELVKGRALSENHVNDGASYENTEKGKGRSDLNSQIAAAMVRESVDYMELKTIIAQYYSAPVPKDLEDCEKKWQTAIDMELMTAEDVTAARSKYILNYQKEHAAPVCSVSSVVDRIHQHYKTEFASVIGCDALELTKEKAKVYNSEGIAISDIVEKDRTPLQIVTDVLSYRNLVAARRAAAWIDAQKRNEAVIKCDAAAAACFAAGASVEDAIKLATQIITAFYDNESARAAAKATALHNAAIDLKVLNTLLCDALAAGRAAAADKIRANRRKVLATLKG